MDQIFVPPAGAMWDMGKRTCLYVFMDRLENVSLSFSDETGKNERGRSHFPQSNQDARKRLASMHPPQFCDVAAMKQPVFCTVQCWSTQL